MTTIPPSSARPFGTIVLGMSRSGTSAVARMFTQAGFHAGLAADLIGPHSSNPRGHFENRRVVALHDDALAELDASWFDAPDAGSVQQLHPRFAPRIAELIDALVHEAEGRPLVIKDPRAGILTGLWSEQLDGGLLPLLVLRDPAEVALSLQQRDGTPLALGLAGWELHMKRLLQGLHGRDTIVVRYDKLIAEPGLAADVVADVARALPEALTRAIIPAAAQSAIETAMRRSRADADTETALTPEQASLWAWLAELPRVARIALPDPLTDLSISTTRRVAAERGRAEGQAELVAARRQAAFLEEELRKALFQADAHEVRCEALSAEIEEIRLANLELREAYAHKDATVARISNSRSWRLTRPLRASGALARLVVRRPADPSSR